MSRLVIKFGGNVLRSEGGIQDILKVIASQRSIWDDLIIVTSALSGVTDALHQVVQTAASGNTNAMRDEIADIRNLHVEAAHFAISNNERRAVLLKELDSLIFTLLDDCDEIRQRRQALPELADRVVAMGERLITRVIGTAARAQNLRCVEVDSTQILVTDDRHSNARPIFNLSQQNIEKNLKPLLHSGIVPIVTGYLGATQQGAVTTLGRGGSDYSATYLGALLEADEIWFFTDVQGLMTADPQSVASAKVLGNSSYREVAEMAQFGARVLHPRAIEPLIAANIPLRIRSISHLDQPGTYISAQAPLRDYRIHAVTQVPAVLVVGDSHSNMASACNQLLSQVLRDEIEPTLSVQNHRSNLLVYISPTSANRQSFQYCIDLLRNYEQATPHWDVQEVSVIAIIGLLKLRNHLAILQRLAQQDISPLAFGQGRERVFLLAVHPDDATTAIQEIHSLIP